MGRFARRASVCKQAAGGFIWFENKSQFLPKWSSRLAAALPPHVFLLTKQRRSAPLLGRKHCNIQGPLHWPFCHGGPGQVSHAATGGAAGGEWTNVRALTQFDRKWYSDFRVMPMGRILKRVAMSSSPPPSLGGYQRRESIPIGGEGFLCGWIYQHTSAGRAEPCPSHPALQENIRPRTHALEIRCVDLMSRGIGAHLRSL